MRCRNEKNSYNATAGTRNHHQDKESEDKVLKIVYETERTEQSPELNLILLFKATGHLLLLRIQLKTTTTWIVLAVVVVGV